MSTRMRELPLKVLLVEDSPGDARLLRESLTEVAGDAFELTWAKDLDSACRMASVELIDAIVLDLNLPDSNGFETFAKIRSEFPDLPVLVLTGLEDDQLGLKAIQQGAQDYLSKADVNGAKVARSLRYAVERHRSRVREFRTMRAAPRGRAIGFLGVKGGVGATTVALNVGALLAKNTNRSVIAAELRGDYGSFATHLHETPAHTLASLLDVDLATMTDSVLYKCMVRSRLGFDVLFAPQHPGDFADLDPDMARRIIDRLARHAAYTMVDLPGFYHPVTDAAIRTLDLLVLLTERDPSSIAAAEVVLEYLRQKQTGAPPVGLVVVNRSLLIDGAQPRQIEADLRCELFGVVPPAPEVSISAVRSGTPMALHRPLSAPATMLAKITESIARHVSPPASTGQARLEPLSA